MFLEKSDLFVFSDGSFDPKSKKGVAAVLLVSALQWDTPGLEFMVQTKEVGSSSNGQVELEAALWGLRLAKETSKGPLKIQLITDCETIVDLARRRPKLEKVGFLSQRTGKRLSNADLYEQFFQLSDELNPTITWIKGHTAANQKTETHRVFGLVDKAARKALRR